MLKSGFSLTSIISIIILLLVWLAYVNIDLSRLLFGLDSERSQGGGTSSKDIVHRPFYYRYHQQVVIGFRVHGGYVGVLSEWNEAGVSTSFMAKDGAHEVVISCGDTSLALNDRQILINKNVVNSSLLDESTSISHELILYKPSPKGDGWIASHYDHSQMPSGLMRSLSVLANGRHVELNEKHLSFLFKGEADKDTVRRAKPAER